jgi:hypothetical protein
VELITHNDGEKKCQESNGTLLTFADKTDLEELLESMQEVKTVDKEGKEVPHDPSTFFWIGVEKKGWKDPSDPMSKAIFMWSKTEREIDENLVQINQEDCPLLAKCCYVHFHPYHLHPDTRLPEAKFKAHVCTDGSRARSLICETNNSGKIKTDADKGFESLEIEVTAREELKDKVDKTKLDEVQITGFGGLYTLFAFCLIGTILLILTLVKIRKSVI